MATLALIFVVVAGVIVLTRMPERWGRLTGPNAAISGITFGSALAIVISYTNLHSVGWAIVHGLLSWIYVIFYVLKSATKG